MDKRMMVLELVKHELAFLIANPQELEAIAEFFARGGFNAWSDDDIVLGYRQSKQEA